MTQIKSEKAKAMIDKHWNCIIKGENLSVGYKVSLAAVKLAETDAEERHDKELQQLKDKVVEVFKSYQLYCECRGISETGNLRCFNVKLNEK